MSSVTTSRISVLPLSQTKQGGGEVVSPDPGQSSELADEALIARVQTGDRDALSLLFRRYAHRVRNVGQRILRDKTEADDLVQEVFIYIHRKSTLFDSGKGPAGSWIVQVAYTQALLRRRQLKSHGFYLSGITDKPFECLRPSDRASHYDNSVEGFFGRNGWKKIWDSLTEYQRETFRLHFFEGCTFTEIADKLGQSYVNIRHHYYRGLEKLRKYADENDLNWP